MALRAFHSRSSRGWKTRLLVFGVNGVMLSRGGGIVNAAVSEPIALLDSKERTSVRCDFQLEGMSADVLGELVNAMKETIRYEHDIRCEHLGLFMDVKC